MRLHLHIRYGGGVAVALPNRGRLTRIWTVPAKMMRFRSSCRLIHLCMLNCIVLSLSVSTHICNTRKNVTHNCSPKLRLHFPFLKTNQWKSIVCIFLRHLSVCPPTIDEYGKSFRGSPLSLFFHRHPKKGGEDANHTMEFHCLDLSGTSDCVSVPHWFIDASMQRKSTVCISQTSVHGVHVLDEWKPTWPTMLWDSVVWAHYTHLFVWGTPWNLAFCRYCLLEIIAFIRLTLKANTFESTIKWSWDNENISLTCSCSRKMCTGSQHQHISYQLYLKEIWTMRLHYWHTFLQSPLPTESYFCHFVFQVSPIQAWTLKPRYWHIFNHWPSATQYLSQLSPHRTSSMGPCLSQS